MAIDKELIDILACPQCKGDVKVLNQDESIVCDVCGLLYEVRGGIPVMMVAEARRWAGAMDIEGR